MEPRIARRSVLAAGAGTLVSLGLMSDARAATGKPTVIAHPCTEDGAIVLVKGLTGVNTITLRDDHGRAVGDGTVKSGAAVVPVWVPRGGHRQLHLEVGGNKLSFATTASSAALLDSPWIAVNTTLTLEANFVPKKLSTVDGYQLRPEVCTAFTKMQQQAARSGLKLSLTSGYRSHADQVATLRFWMRELGADQAHQVSARPGTSEHQTGLALDAIDTSGDCTLKDCFGQTSLGKWLAANSYRFGFVVRYEQGQKAITGYDYEPWHLRYLGTDMATQYHLRKVHTLEELFRLRNRPGH